MHTWLPDAHSEAPAPVSALMSGVLLCGRASTRSSASGPSLSRRRARLRPPGLLLGFGLVSMAVAAAFLWAPRNYKRMLAYSSVEHMGLACLGIAFGGTWGVAGPCCTSSTTRSPSTSLFILAGRILQRVGTSAEIAHGRGPRAGDAGTAAVFLAATLALVGLPPFGLFVSEIMIMRAGLESGQWWGGRRGPRILLVVVFGGVLRAVEPHALRGRARPSRATVRCRLPLVPVTLEPRPAGHPRPHVPAGARRCPRARRCVVTHGG